MWACVFRKESNRPNSRPCPAEISIPAGLPRSLPMAWSNIPRAGASGSARKAFRCSTRSSPISPPEQARVGKPAQSRPARSPDYDPGTRPLGRLPDGRRRCSANSVQRHPAADRGTVAVTGSGIDVKRSIVLRSIKSQERDASDHPNSSFPVRWRAQWFTERPSAPQQRINDTRTCQTGKLSESCCPISRHLGNVG